MGPFEKVIQHDFHEGRDIPGEILNTQIGFEDRPPESFVFRMP
jgi:hypothetical protein